MLGDADDPGVGVSNSNSNSSSEHLAVTGSNSNTNTPSNTTNTNTDATNSGTFGNWSNQESWVPTTARDSLQDSLLSLTRRHSLPTHAALVGLLGRFGRGGRARDGIAATDTNTATMRDIAVAPASTGIARSRSNSFAVGTAAAADRYKYGHRHTRSEADHQPVVVVKNYQPPRTQVSRVVEEEEEMEVALPKIDDFSWGAILKSVDPQVNATLASISTLSTTFQDTLRHEVSALSSTQSALDTRIKETDALAARVLKTTKARVDSLHNSSSGLKGGAAVDALADATEATHTLITSIISTLLAIDEMLPPPDRLSPENSAHKKHYPRLHSLLLGKATELNLCFKSGRSERNGKRPSTADAGNGFPSSMPEFSSSDLNQPPHLRRRMSSSSCLLLSGSGGGAGGGGGTARAPPPQLQLKTILPSSEMYDEDEGSYFPIAPRTATGISLATSNASVTSGGRRASRGSAWGGAASSIRRQFRRIDEAGGEGSSAVVEDGEESPMTPDMPATPHTPLSPKRSFRRSSGSWSGFGWLGRWEEEEEESAEDRLRDVLERMEMQRRKQTRDLKGKGKGKLVA
ncbi:hypothetical protein BZA77DRAFT_46412 [Pyronema omphalodes]|nr:hypothetical protein BZA77DRAFT_46412 [Pyronema omphalodes]